MVRRGWIAILSSAMVFALWATPAAAQGGSNTATLSGVVTDKDGGVIPGATVTVKNVATGESQSKVTNESGAYSFPGMNVGSYKVTITLTGFKTADIDVRLTAGSSNEINTKLEVGAISEVVNVTAGTDLIRTNTPTVTSVVNADFIQTLPRNDRTALNFLIFMPGVTTIGGAQSARGSTISGLPQNTINITIDGISNSNLLQSGDGFFTLVGTRLDAVEEVAMTSATAGADATGQGAVQIRFQTRSGTNRFETSLYSYNQHAKFNSNAYFTRLAGLAKPQATNYTYGGRVGGPIIIPGVFDGRGKAFFFFNQEEVYAPAETTRTRTMIRQSALNGDFRYIAGGVTNSVNVLALAAANGQLATYDPTIKSLLEAMRAASATTGSVQEVATSPNTAAFAWQVSRKTYRHAPTTNITVNLTPKHRLQGSYYWQRFADTPDTLNSADPSYPGFPHFSDQTSFRTTASMSLRSTMSSSIVNELRGGWQWSPVQFFLNETADMFSNQGGYNVNLGFGLTNAAWGGFANAPEERNTWNWTIDDTFSYLKGAHTMMFGGNFTRVINWIDDWNTVQDVNLGFNTTFDPAETMFNNTNGPINFPGSSAADRTNARSLYALLTGRVASLPGTFRLNEAGTEYLYNGHIIQRERMDEYSFFAQDQWRWKPNVTVTAGVRYELQFPMVPTNGVFTTTNVEGVCGPSGLGSGPGGRFCNMFNPGVLNNPSVVPQFERYSPDSKGYDVDYNNFAPNIGISWRPNVQSGFMRTLLGDPEVATVSSGFSRSYNRERFDRFTTVFGGNPGATLNANQNTGTGIPLVPPGETWPILLRESNRLSAPTAPLPTLPIIATPANNLRIFDPEIEVPYTDSWQVGLQRSLDRNTVFEARYVGNSNKLPWTNENWNQVNIYENQFYSEFQLAQANLRANVLAGRASDGFRYTGIPGTSPLPIFLAHFSGLSASNAANPCAYIASTAACPLGGNGLGGANASQFTNAGPVGNLDPFFPAPLTLAGTLNTGNSGAYFNSAKALNYPVNFWQMNPLGNAASVMRNFGGGTNHNVIAEVRRRLSAGLAVNVSYTWQRQYQILTSANANSTALGPGSNFEIHQREFNLQAQGVPHAFKMLWTYDIPYGRGKRYGANINPWLDYVIGGWTFAGTGRVQIQDFVLRNSRVVGMSLDEARSALKEVRFVTDAAGVTTVWNFPQDVLDNTRRAYNTDETQPTFYSPGNEPTGRYFAPAGGPGCNYLYPGDCDTNDLWFRGRWFGEFDFRIAKMIPLPSKARFEISAEVFNALMAKNFPISLTPNGTSGACGAQGGAAAVSFGRICTTQSAARTAQLVFRVSW